MAWLKLFMVLLPKHNLLKAKYIPKYISMHEAKRQRSWLLDLFARALGYTPSAPLWDLYVRWKPDPTATPSTRELLPSTQGKRVAVETINTTPVDQQMTYSKRSWKLLMARRELNWCYIHYEDSDYSREYI